jgi:hypothetical protein
VACSIYFVYIRFGPTCEDRAALLPGEPKLRMHAQRIGDGISLMQSTWDEIAALAASAGLARRKWDASHPGVHLSLDPLAGVWVELPLLDSTWVIG